MRSLHITIKMSACFPHHRRIPVRHHVGLACAALSFQLRRNTGGAPPAQCGQDALSAWAPVSGSLPVCTCLLVPGLPDTGVSKPRATSLLFSQQNAHPS